MRRLLDLLLVLLTLHGTVVGAWCPPATASLSSSRWKSRGCLTFYAKKQYQPLGAKQSSALTLRASSRRDDASSFSSSESAPPMLRLPALGSVVTSLLLALTVLVTPLASTANEVVSEQPQQQQQQEQQVSVASSTTTTSASAAAPLPTNGGVPDRRYWTLMRAAEPQERASVNRKLMDFAVLAINTEYYDYSGGASFQPADFYKTFRQWLKENNNYYADNNSHDALHHNHQNLLETREGVVQGLQWLVGQLPDPFSRYLTREELRAELGQSSHGFLGLGAMVTSPDQANPFFGSLTTPVLANLPPSSSTTNNNHYLLSAMQISKLPVITAVTPDSPAERAGLVVGDRIVAVGADSFLHHHAPAKMPEVVHKYSSAENYVGWSELSVAKPVYASPLVQKEEADQDTRDVIVAYRPTRVRLPTVLTAADEWSSYWKSSDDAATTPVASSSSSSGRKIVAGGDAVVHYELLQSRGTIFDQLSYLRGEDSRSSDEEAMASSSTSSQPTRSVGYIRPTRFSRASTQGFVNAVQELEQAGATSYIIDLRNNYGGLFSEAMLTASTLLRDPHAVLCYTMNARENGITRNTVEEYIVDSRFPGYLLSSEPRTATLDQVKREHPELRYLDQQNKNGGAAPAAAAWTPQSLLVSLHDEPQGGGAKKRSSNHYHHYHSRTATARLMTAAGEGGGGGVDYYSEWDHRQAQLVKRQWEAQKKVVLLINEGTASAAEVFAAALHDNGRTVALVGTKTYGKGLIQRTFPMPDGGGLRLTVAEYLTPSLRHVTRVGGAGFDRATGEWVGGGINPDVRCESRQGIPRNVGADLCVGMALDVLE